MKKYFFHDIEIYTLNQKNKEKLIKEQGGLLSSRLTALYKQNVTLLNDERVIYEGDAITFLFNTERDLKKFIEIRDSLMKKETTSSFSLGKNFIEMVPLYLETFENESGLSLSYTNIKELKKVDAFINGLHKKGSEIKRYRVMLVAVIGEYIKNTIPNSSWAYFESKQGQTVSIFDKEKSAIYGPHQIVEKEFDYYLPKEGQVAFFDNVQIERIRYGVIKKF